MVGKPAGTVYTGTLPLGVKKILRLANCTEVVIAHWDSKLFRQIVRETGLRCKKARADEFACSCAMRVLERIHATDGVNNYEVTKPRRFWFSTHVTDVVGGSVRVDDREQSTEVTAKVLELYLKRQGRPLRGEGARDGPRDTAEAGLAGF